MRSAILCFLSLLLTILVLQGALASNKQVGTHQGQIQDLSGGGGIFLKNESHKAPAPCNVPWLPVIIMRAY